MNFSQKIYDLAAKFSELWVIKCIRAGLLYMLPITFIGAFTVLLLNFPIPAVQHFMNEITHGNWDKLLTYIHYGTFSILSISAFFSISYQLCSTSKTLKEDNISALAVSLITSAATAIFCANQFQDGTILPNALIDINGLYIAIIASVFLSCTFIFFYKHRIFNLRVFTDRADLIFEHCIKVLEPALMTFAVSGLLRISLSYFTLPIGELLQSIFKNGSMLSVLVYEFLSHLLWFLGIPGNNIMESITGGYLLNAFTLNQQFLNLFVFLGGSGATLCLILALLLTSKRKSSKIAKFSLIPSIFNVTEIMIYGLPIVLNPFFLIPFVLVPIVLTITSYIAVLLGFISPVIQFETIWTTPFFIGGFTATNSLNAIILQFINLLIGTLLYIPFCRAYYKQRDNNNKKYFNTFIDAAMKGDVTNVLDRNDEIGLSGRLLLNDILEDFKSHKATKFFVEFQPQVNNDGSVIGAETLLRYKHDEFGFIPPPVIVQLLTESGYENKIGYFVIESCLKAQAELIHDNLPISLSLNISANQLKDQKLLDILKKLFAKYQVPPSLIKFELLEDEDILDTLENRDIIESIQKLGSSIMIDDFGMGHSSIMYLKRFNINTIKLDGELVKDILHNTKSKNIVKSVCSLCQELNLETVAEFVETKEQKEYLESLGCSIYQGYYYSKPLSLDKLKTFVMKTNNI